jgi:hypothetical protein
MFECTLYACGQRDFPYGRLMCTASCMLYAFYYRHDYTTRQGCCNNGLPSETVLRKLFEAASKLHIQVISKMYGDEYPNSMLSVHDIICTSPNQLIGSMKEVHGSFEIEHMDSFDFEAIKDSQVEQLATDSSLHDETDVIICDITTAMQRFLTPGTTAIVTLEDFAHTIAIHMREDASFVMFDPLPAKAIHFQSLQQLLEDTFSKMSGQFVCYFMPRAQLVN